MQPTSSFPFCLTTCPICHDPALEAVEAAGIRKFHCCICGSFDIAPRAAIALKGMSRTQREHWLKSAQTSAGAAVPLIKTDDAPREISSVRGSVSDHRST
jgi:hypothetical protein